MPTTTTTTVLSDQGGALGSAVPPFTAHAISVSLPTWKDVVGYEEGEQRVVDTMVSGYPRFFINLIIQKLAHVCAQKFGVNGELCLLLPTKKVADLCRSFMLDQSDTPVNVRLIEFLICPEDKENKDLDTDCGCSPSPAPPTSKCTELHIVLFPAAAFPVAKLFWQHSGMGISSRLAEHCLSLLPAESPRPDVLAPKTNRLPSKGSNRHYSVKSLSGAGGLSSSKVAPREDLSKDQSVYLEERFGRNLPITSASAAKRALRRRIAGVLVQDSPDDCSGGPCAGGNDVEVGPSSRGVDAVSESDVFLYPTGMAAIWNAHHLASAVRPPAKSVCFGFPYIDTLKILEKWGPGCHFLGNGLDSDIDTLETILEREAASSSTPPILSLFTEFPSNPLLRSADLPRLRRLADKYDFLIVIDETIGNFVNVEVMPYADIVVSSLTKVFSGDANVMGGSLVLNPKGRHYEKLKSHLVSTFEDIYFDEDAVYMERNSRPFQSRVKTIDENTEAICDYLRAHSVAGGVSSAVINEIYYPKWSTPEHYEHCRIKSRPSRGDASTPRRDGGYGGLFSVTFTSLAASQAFYDALPCLKGPSLGTSFTLASPYTILAHYVELDWAAKYGVTRDLVRISVGMEDKDELLRGVEFALKAAEAAATTS
ncbi:hypothetical protein PLICRDRAFT_699219 [Plicaturopsis crispa FD-325 SS-3]|nr:hypothetical protein PLICRDRAFT_699219 [Plicaturopsis crispa FD-325 SS-3]